MLSAERYPAAHSSHLPAERALCPDSPCPGGQDGKAPHSLASSALLKASSAVSQRTHRLSFEVDGVVPGSAPKPAGQLRQLEQRGAASSELNLPLAQGMQLVEALVLVNLPARHASQLVLDCVPMKKPGLHS